MNKAKQDKIIKARDLGYAAATRGLPCAPALDSELTALLGDTGDNLALLRAWQKGHFAYWPQSTVEPY